MPTLKVATLRHTLGLRINCCLTSSREQTEVNCSHQLQVYKYHSKESGVDGFCYVSEMPCIGSPDAQSGQCACTGYIQVAPRRALTAQRQDTEWRASLASNPMSIFFQITSPNPLKMYRRSSTTGWIRIQKRDLARAQPTGLKVTIEAAAFKWKLLIKFGAF